MTSIPQLGAVGALSITPDGDELASRSAPQSRRISRWRLDGSGLVTSHVAEGHALTTVTTPRRIAMLVGRRSPRRRSEDDFAISRCGIRTPTRIDGSTSAD